jgi:hypothetical protein
MLTPLQGLLEFTIRTNIWSNPVFCRSLEHRWLERDHCFDLCIVDIDDGDLSAFSVIYQVIERVMCAGSTVILLARRTHGLELRRDDPDFITGMFPGSGYARIWYTNSLAARLATNIVESARVLCRQTNVPQFIARPVRVAALFMAAPLALGSV